MFLAILGKRYADAGLVDILIETGVLAQMLALDVCI